MSIIYTNSLHLQNVPKFQFFGLKLNHLATPAPSGMKFLSSSSCDDVIAFTHERSMKESERGVGKVSVGLFLCLSPLRHSPPQQVKGRNELKIFRHETKLCLYFFTGESRPSV
jgi:hypothetical protein